MQVICFQIMYLFLDIFYFDFQNPIFRATSSLMHGHTKTTDSNHQLDDHDEFMAKVSYQCLIIFSYHKSLYYVNQIAAEKKLKKKHICIFLPVKMAVKNSNCWFAHGGNMRQKSIKYMLWQVKFYTNGNFSNLNL